MENRGSEGLWREGEEPLPGEPKRGGKVTLGITLTFSSSPSPIRAAADQAENGD